MALVMAHVPPSQPAGRLKDNRLPARLRGGMILSSDLVGPPDRFFILFLRLPEDTEASPVVRFRHARGLWADGPQNLF
jgi:hypothetical protein